MMQTAMRAIIIDDEADARENLQILLNKYCPDVELAATADSAVNGFEAIRKHQPDLVFLDINMPEATGLEMLEQLGEIEFEIIFVTAYDEYAIKAIKFAALDYLLKPINILELKSAVSKAEKKKEQKTGMEQIRSLAESYGANGKKIGLSTSEGVIYVYVKEIVRCEASDTYTTFFMKNGEKVMISKSLKEYENMLAGFNFFRVHQSHLINLEFVKKYVKGIGGHVEMMDGSIIGIARRKKDEFLERLEAFNN